MGDLKICVTELGAVSGTDAVQTEKFQKVKRLPMIISSGAVFAL